MMEVAVIGPGTMGKGIAQVFAGAGMKTHLVGRSLDKLGKARKDIERGLDSLVLKKKMTKARVKAIMGNIHVCLGDNSLPRADLIIEAIPENPILKKALFKDISKVVKKGAIIATNTSALSITELSKSVRDKGSPLQLCLW